MVLLLYKYLQDIILYKTVESCWESNGCNINFVHNI